MENIGSEEISVVVQGAIYKKNTKKCLKSIRKYLPKAQIILSSWVGSDFGGLDYDILIENDDPGFEYWNPEKTIPLNLNRQLVSSMNGVRAAKRKYILKLRTDLILNGLGFLEYFDKFQASNPDFQLTKRKVVASCLYSIKHEKFGNFINKTPFHVSDWFYFGLNEDIQKIYEINVPEIKTFARYFENNRQEDNFPCEIADRLWQYPSEMYITLSFAKQKFPEINIRHCRDFSNMDMELSEKFIMNNFIILDYLQSNISIEKKYYKKMYEKIYLAPEQVFEGLIRFNIYEQLYKKYCDADYKVSKDLVIQKRKLFRTNKKIEKNLNTVLAPIKDFGRWLNSVFNLAKYLILYLLNK